jgi:putative membrane protein
MSKFAQRVISSTAVACLIFGSAVAIAIADNPQPAGTNAQPPANQGAGLQDPGRAAGGREAQGMWMEQIQKADTPDKLFLLQVAAGCQAGTQWAQLAQQKSQNAQVKQLSDAILKDHQQLTQALQKAIEQQGLQMPQGVPPIVQQELKVAQSLSGEQFDQRFLSCTKAGHAAAVSAFEDEARIASDPNVKQFASQNLPTLQQHAQLIQQAAVALGLPSGTEARQAGQRIPPAGTGIERR